MYFLEMIALQPSALILGILDHKALLSFCYICRRISIGQFEESIPKILTPLKINGYTVVGSSGDATLPQQVTEPPYFIDLIVVARISPPIVSITPAQSPFNIGLPVVSAALFYL